MAESAMHWVHDWDPFLIYFGNGYGIRWYGVAYLLGIIVAWWYASRSYRQRRMPLNPKRLQDAAVWIGLGMIIGGRVFYCLFYYNAYLEVDGVMTFVTAPGAILRNPLYLFQLWEGGMASHGGALGLFTGALLYWLKQRRRFSLLVLADCGATLAPVGIILGRLANFINGELWGRVSKVSWAMKFPHALPDDLALLAPADRLSALTTLQTHAIDLATRLHDNTPIFDPLNYLMRNGFATNGAPHPELVSAVAAVGLARHPSQLYAVVMEGLLILAIVLPIHQRHRRPGLSIGLMLTLYAAGRFIDEFFRQPDEGYSLYFGWMSKGQLYSLPLLLVAGAFLWRALGRPPRPTVYLPLEDDPA